MNTILIENETDIRTFVEGVMDYAADSINVDPNSFWYNPMSEVLLAVCYYTLETKEEPSIENAYALFGKAKDAYQNLETEFSTLRTVNPASQALRHYDAFKTQAHPCEVTVAMDIATMVKHFTFYHYGILL